jgi:hypothetical protein
MKKVLILLFVLCATFAQASTYKYLVFTNTAGTTTAFGVNNLTLTIDGSQLQVTSADGSVNIALTDLKSMQFSADGTTALEKVIDADAPVQVYSISGASLGTYESMLEAAKSLHAGSYVISNGNQSQIIVIK